MMMGGALWQLYLEYEKDMDPLVERGVWRRGLTGGTQPVDMRWPSARQVTQLLYQPWLQGVGRVDPAERVNRLSLNPGPEAGSQFICVSFSEKVCILSDVSMKNSLAFSSCK